jgi:hypothetical protein
MRTSHQRRRETFLRLKDFAATHTDIAVVAAWPPLVTEIQTVITNLEGYTADQSSHDGAALQGTDLRGSARSALREAIERIVRTARGIAEKHPGFDAKFRMPEGKNDQDFVDAGLGMVKDAAPAEVKAKFLSYGMPADFIDDLLEDIAEFQETITDQSSSVGDRKAAKRLIDQTVDQGMSVKRQMDPIVRNFYHDRPDVLAEWETASHVERGPRRKKGGPEEPPKNEPAK